jgi:outer membrane assembly lipoprotein YfiO
MVLMTVWRSGSTARLGIAGASLVVLVALSAALAAGCGGSNPQAVMPAPGTVDPDKFLFDRGVAAVEKKHYIEAREYFKRVVDGYPQSPYRADAKLGLADAFLAEKHVDADIVAISQYREFLQFYPTSPRADYAQYQICVAQSRQILNAERDQSSTVEAIKQTEHFLEAYPNSKWRPDVLKLDRAAKDRLSDHEFVVGIYYFRIKNYAGAIDRFTYLLSHDTAYTKQDVVFYYLAESFVMNKMDGAALPLYEKIVSDYPQSKFVEPSKKRIGELKR